MPVASRSIYDLIDELLHPKNAPGVGYTLKQAATHPLEVAKGATATFGKQLGGAVRQNAANMAAALGLFDVLPEPPKGEVDLRKYVTDKPIKGFSPFERAGAVANAAMLGIPDVLTSRINEQITKGGTPESTGEKIARGIQGGSEFIAKDIAPGQETMNLLSGQVTNPATGKPEPITPEQIGTNLTQGLIKTLMLAEPVARMTGAGGKFLFGEQAPNQLGQVPTNINKVVSSGEIYAGVAGEKIMTPAKAAERLGMPIEDAVSQGLATVTGEKGGRAYLTDKGVKQYVEKTTGATIETPPSTTDRIQSTLTEVQALKERAEKTVEEAAKVTEPSPEVVEPIRQEPELQNHLNMKQALQVEETRAIANEAIRTDILRDIVADVKPDDFKMTNHIAEAIERGALSADTVIRISEKYEVPVEQASKWMADQIKDVESFGGKTLEVMSAPAKQFWAEQVLKVTKAPGIFQSLMDRLQGKEVDPALNKAIDIVKMLDKIETYGKKDGPLTLWEKAMNLTRMVRNVRLADMVSQLQTATRDAGAQGMTSVVEMAEHALTGTVHAILGAPDIIKGKRTLGDYYWDLTSDFSSLYSRFNPKEQVMFNEMLNNFPLVKRNITSTSHFDLQTNVLADWIRGSKPKGAEEWVSAWSNFATMFEGLQERWFKNLHLQNRLESNLRQSGYKGDILKQVVNATKLPELPEEIRFAMADAWEHALTQTYARSFNPKDGMAGAIMDTYRKLPFLTEIGPTFPRFSLNALRWTMEHSPTLVFNMFEPEFREALFKGLDGGFQSAEARRTLARGMSGIAMLTTAYAIHNSDAAGPRYHQIWTGKTDKDGNKIYLSAQNYGPPFETYMLLGRLITATKKGEPLNKAVDEKELTDAMVNVRNIKDIPLFGFIDIARDLMSDNEATREKAFNTYIGKYLGSFFIPLNMISDFRAATGHPEAAIRRNVQGNELVGYIQKNIPFAAEELPAYTNPFTGQPIIKEEAGKVQMTGITRQTITPLEEMALKHDIPYSKIAGEHNDVKANEAVKKAMGQMFTYKVNKDQTVGDIIAKSLTNLNLSPQVEKEQLEKILSDFRQSAVRQAEGETYLEHQKKGGRYAFSESIIRKADPSLREIYKEQLKKMGLY